MVRVRDCFLGGKWENPPCCKTADADAKRVSLEVNTGGGNIRTKQRKHAHRTCDMLNVVQVKAPRLFLRAVINKFS